MVLDMNDGEISVPKSGKPVRNSDISVQKVAETPVFQGGFGNHRSPPVLLLIPAFTVRGREDCSARMEVRTINVKNVRMCETPVYSPRVVTVLNILAHSGHRMEHKHQRSDARTGNTTLRNMTIPMGIYRGLPAVYPIFPVILPGEEA